jgi:hypothetical protein
MKIYSIISSENNVDKVERTLNEVFCPKWIISVSSSTNLSDIMKKKLKRKKLSMQKKEYKSKKVVSFK